MTGARPWLLALALFGLFVPNGIFVFVVVTQPHLLLDALSHPLTVVFMAEALALTGLAAWWLHLRGDPRPGWLGFIALSLLGSLLFSVPLTLYLHARTRDAAFPARALR